jgi:hypothetical protein
LWHRQLPAEVVEDLRRPVKARLWISVGCIALVVGTSAAVVYELRPELLGRQTGGPLACKACGRTATSGPARVGQAVTMGPLTLENDGRKTVTLERVELLDIDPGLQTVGVIVVKPDGTGLVGSAYGFPPTRPGGTTHSVRGYRIPPATARSQFVQILVGIRLTKPGRAGARRMVVYYREGEVPYRAYFDHSVWLCTDWSAGANCVDPDWYRR